MAFSPAAVFADVEATAEPGDAVETAAEPGDAADNEAAAPEQVVEEAQDEDADLAPVEAEAVQDEAVAAEGEEPPVTVNPYDACTWVDLNTRNQARDASGTIRTGLFKAAKAGGGTGLYFAGTDTMVVKEVRLVTVSDGWRFIYHPYTPGDGEYWKDVTGGTYTYLINNHSGDFYIENVEGIYTVNGAKYFVNSDGTVRTDAGILSYNGNKYYVQSGGAILTTAGWVNADARYYLPAETAAEGKLRIAEGLFTADGKTWYSANGGAVRTTGGLFIYGGSQYFAFDDGSVNTAEGFITVGGKKYLCASGGAIRATAGVVDYGGKKYVALADGSICTSTGFINAGGARYYVSDSSGALVVNKEFKSGSKKYHALANGVIAIGVHKWGKNYYYSDSYGAIRTKKGIVSWAGNRYYVKKGGKITKNKKFKYKGKTYIAGSTGAFLKGVFIWKKNLYYASAKGVLRTKAGAFTYNGNRYYSRKGGKLYRNKLFTVGSKKYLAQIDGTLKAGLFAWGGKYYLTDAKCAVITKAGIYTYGSHQYYVKKGGPLAVSEFVTYKDNHYYAGSDGAIVKKAFTYKGVTITPNSQTGIIPLEEYWKVFPNEAPQETKTDTAA